MKQYEREVYFKDLYIKIEFYHRFQSIGSDIVSSIILHTLFIGRNEQVEEKIAGAVN